MIFSRTASNKDLNYLDVQDNIVSYLQNPSSIENYNTSIYKFWEYSLIAKLINDYNIEKCNVLNIYKDIEDIPLADIINNDRINVTQINLKRFFQLPIRNHRYNILSAFGVFDFVKNEYKLLDKLQKHVCTDGYLIITTNNTKNKKLSQNDLISFSFFLENMGFDFCSDENELVEYSNQSQLHSLVMKRSGI